MANKQDKVRDLFVELINTQLEPHGVSYKDVSGDPQWYMNYRTTPDLESKFIEHCTARIQEELGLSKTMAQKEAGWFILQWGLALEEGSKTKTPSTKSNKKKAK